MPNLRLHTSYCRSFNILLSYSASSAARIYCFSNSLFDCLAFSFSPFKMIFVFTKNRLNETYATAGLVYTHPLFSGKIKKRV